ncbi:MAG: SpoIIE family protein phosphatase [Archangiaceae bacterium]|nr:SpoIIE family protein phosphatase [Archangiaceae bacterium]
MLSTPLQILMLEDDDDFASLISRKLRSSGSELTIAPKLEVALRHLTTRSFDVVLSDLNLPDSRGLETFQKVFATAPKLPIVVLTGEDDDALGLRCVQSGAQDYLVKDLGLDGPILLRALSYAIERKRVQLESARVQEELRRQNEEMSSDLRMAQQVQTAMLPMGNTRSNGLFSFAHRYKPAGPVGGDFFTEFCSPTGACGVVVFDVMGHGVRAALVTGLLRALIDEASVLSLGPERFLTLLNRNLRSIFRQADQQIFVTAVCVIVDPNEKKLSFASAGHPSPLLLDAVNGRVISLEAARGAPLGLADEGTWKQHTVPFGPGNRALMFTDGLYEVEGPDGQQFGLPRLVEAAQRKVNLPAPQLLAELVEESQEYSVTGDFHDDVCAVLLEQTGTGPSTR